MQVGVLYAESCQFNNIASPRFLMHDLADEPRDGSLGVSPNLLCYPTTLD